MSQPVQIRFALIGLDNWYNAFSMAEALTYTSQAKLLWVVDEVLERAQEVAKKYNVPHAGVDYRQALEDPNVDAVACFVSIDKSAELCVAAVEVGKHIISAKPMTMNLTDADRIVSTVGSTNIKYFPGAGSHLFSNVNRIFKKTIDSGRIGKIVSAEGVFHAGLPHEWPDNAAAGWFVDPRRVPGGAWIDHAIFYIHVFRHWFGSEIAHAEGALGNLKYKSLQVEDYGQAIFWFANGTIITVVSSWLAIPGANRQRLEVYGQDGAIIWNNLIKKIAVMGKCERNSIEWIEVPEPSNTVARTAAMIDHFVACIREEQNLLCTVEDDRAALAACLSFYEAAYHT